VTEQDGGSGMQGYRKAEVQGKAKNDKERKVSGEQEREMENKKVVMDRRTEIQRMKKVLLGSTIGIE